MNSAEKLAAYEAMQTFVEAEYEKAAEDVEALRLSGKAKTVRYRETWARKFQLGELLLLYKRWGLLEKDAPL